ncbi:hypothetical protein ACFFX1_55100 [Dactylosporangium sucinum]|uniref:hypothetical protein n=1 Tax=Dactylosporangium sucinum TaxID=1424081 RepID=UPI00167DCB6D|nr:hypothetical protein [Dactylosporangium sucinum]
MITLRNGTQITIDCGTDDGMDELTRFVDVWQSGRRGGADINGIDAAGHPVKASVEYRDVLRVEFPECAG